MITVGTTVVSGAPINSGGGGAGLPVAGGAGEVPVSTGAGTTYAASLFSDEMGTVLAAFLGAVSGQTVIGDGAGDVGTTSADVSALLAAADAAAARTALGLAPSTLAAQARLVAATRRGPVAMTGWSDSNYVAPITAPSSGAQPSIVRGSSFVVSLYAPTAAPGAGAHLAVSADGALAVRGWLIAEGTAGANAGNLVLYSPSDALAVQIPGVSTTGGWHAVAVSVSAAGVVRYSIDGAAAATATGTPALTARTTDDVRIGRGVGGGASGAATALAYLAVWGSVLSDADLAIASATPSAGAPSLPSAPAWEWAAAGHVGCDRVSLVAGIYQVVGAPALWMP